MPVEIEFKDDGRGIEFRATGTLTGNDIIEANKKIYTPKVLKRLKYKLVDRTQCTAYRVSNEAIQIIASQDKQAASINPDIVIAIVSVTPVQYGVTRMWQAYTGDKGFRSMIFGDRPAAVRWIEQEFKPHPANRD